MADTFQNDFCIVFGLDNNSGIYLETISEYKDECIENIANTLFLITTGAINEDISKKLLADCGGDPVRTAVVNRIIDKWKNLAGHYEDMPLIRALQL